MKDPVKNMSLKKRVFDTTPASFNKLALELFNFQYKNNPVYNEYCTILNIQPVEIDSIEKIPFLPISCFKTHQVKSTPFETDLIFESSGTAGSITSRHFIKYVDVYKQSFTKNFEQHYGIAQNSCIIGLLPSYLERKYSSLVFMVEELIQESNHPQSGFYLYDNEKLHSTLIHNELLKIPTILIGVTYALLDFAEAYPMQLEHTIVMETGGMKGRREELTRAEVHRRLQEKLGVMHIHSEYGMTELLSQAYSKAHGVFTPPNWMQVLIRDEDDPFSVRSAKSIDKNPLGGIINIIDLANIYSCAFIATDDAGKLNNDGSFEVTGRVDISDIRGCSLMLI